MVIFISNLNIIQTVAFYIVQLQCR